MKKKITLLILLLLTTTACVRNAPGDPQGDGLDLPPSPTTLFSNTATPKNDTSEDMEEDVTEGANTPENVNSEGTPFIITPTPDKEITPTAVYTTEGTGSNDPDSTETPFATLSIAATLTPTQMPSPAVPPLDPENEFKGSRRFVETFDNGDNWASSTGDPPDTTYIKLFVDGGIMQVTGKVQTFHTWWYSNKNVADGYIEMDMNTGICKTDDAYGFIVRGALSGESARGYIIGFTCDGKFFVNRLDSGQQYPTFVIYIPTPGETLHRGTNQQNTVGVKMEDEIFQIYANGYLIGQFVDTIHTYGRYGLFVSAGPTANYTYEVSEIRIWDWSNTE